MNEKQKLKYKKELYEMAVDIIGRRIVEAKQAMNNAQDAANNEEKSSAGDKYETSRAMGHIEKDMHAKQFAANNKELADLLSINCEKICNVVEAGCLIICGEEVFFITAGLGKVNSPGKNIYFLSPLAPLAKLLFNKKVGDTIIFNNRQLIIKELY